MTEKIKKKNIITPRSGAFVFCILICLGFSLAAGKAEAHFLLVDKNIGAVLHVDPKDDPLAGSKSTFTFEFKDTSNELNLKLCDCTFSITNNGSPIYSGKFGQDPLIIFTNDTASFTFTIPTKGVYTITAEGEPAATGNFQPFKLTYDLHVDKEISGDTAERNALARFFGGHAAHYILFGGAILISIYIVIRDKKRQKNIK